MSTGALPRDSSSTGALHRVAAWIALPGTIVVLLTNLAAGVRGDIGVLISLLAFTAWALVPYGVLHALGRQTRQPWLVIGAGLFATALEVGIRLSVFVFPRGSTAALALIFSPLTALFVAMPLGAATGWLVSRAAATGARLLTAVVVTLGLCVLALITLGLARPDLFPSTVYARRRALARIGEVGVHVGNDMFESVPVDAPHGWYLTGDFDGQPGDELASISRDEVQLFDGQTLQLQSTRALGGDAARWNWFSRLARSGGDLVRVDTGGGFQETQVLALDGTLRFRYHPDDKLPPNALPAADLDGDGDTEFYASTQAYLARLDGAGREVWRQPQPSTQIVGLHPASSTGPAWLLTRVYGRPLVLWTPQGTRIAEVPERDTSYRDVLGIVEWRGRRLIAYGGDALTLRDADGTTQFEWQVPDMRIVGAWAARFTIDQEPMLIVQAMADRDTHRARLQIVDAAGTLRYDDVADQLSQILIAQHADGTGTLLASMPALHALRLRH